MLQNDEAIAEKFIESLPEVDITEYTNRLSDSSRAIQRALPNSRYGSSTDKYGYKRCSSAVTAFKTLFNEQFDALSDGPRSSALKYCLKAISIIKDATYFDDSNHNKYKIQCLIKLLVL